MIRTLNIRWMVTLLLATFALCFLSLFVPDSLDTRFIGFSGDFKPDGFTVLRVAADGPADAAGIIEGDIVTARDGTATVSLHKTYVGNWGGYLEQYNRPTGEQIVYEVLREGETLTLPISPRHLTPVEYGRIYGLRIFLITILFALAVMIVASSSARIVLLVGLCFCFSVFWLASDSPNWTNFYSPLLRNLGHPRFYLDQTIQIVSLELVLSSLLHCILVFPNPQQSIVRRRWIVPVIYAVPLCVISFGFWWGESGNYGERLASVYPVRLWLNSAFLGVIMLGMLDGYRRRQTRIERVQSRLMYSSIAIFFVLHLALWNLPRMFLGDPFIPDYDWLLVPATWIPISIFFAISRYELFGIRTLVRRRIRLIENLLTRQRRQVRRRDERIQILTRELEQLKTELVHYVAEERPSTAALNEDGRLRRLLGMFPELDEIKKHRLLGESARWNKIFEEIVLASNGDASVLIVGDSGTGKSDIAWSIQHVGNRRNAVYEEISCAQFEHADPAFALGQFFGIGKNHGLPNAPRDGQPGLLSTCDGGTLFLDDFDRLPLNVQDLLLYPLENKPFYPGIGKGPAQTVDIKFILATNRNPEQLVEAGLMRGDVLARLAVRVNVPALRERSEDIPLLAKHFMETAAADLMYDIHEISPNAMHYLTSYAFEKGNVRELKIEITRAVGKAILEQDHTLRAGYLSEELQRAVDVSPQFATTDGPRVVKVTDSTPGDSNPAPESAGGGDFDDSAELTVLRKHHFHIKASEQELGFSHKSKTLTNYLRGICISAYCGSHWDAAEAARMVVGTSDSNLSSKMERKIRRYIANIERHVRRGTQDTLYRNLPAAYHGVLAQTIEKTRDSAR